MARRVVHPLLSDGMQQHLGRLLELRDARLAELVERAQRGPVDTGAADARRQRASDAKMRRTFGGHRRYAGKSE